MDKKQVEEAIFEALLRQAVIDKYHAEIEAIPSSTELSQEISFTPEFEFRMKKLFAYERRKILINTISMYSKRIASIFIISIAIMFGILFLHPEVRAATNKAIVELYKKFTSIIFIGESSEVDKRDWYPMYLPDGYYENSVEDLGKVTYIEFINDKGEKIRFSYRAEGSTSNLSIDNENHIIENIKVNENMGYSAIALTEEFENGVIWTIDGFKLDLWSRLSITEIKKIAESVSEKNK
jgi:hypothetical protein